jgi:DNA-binding transcriptional LysR family regulator
MKYHQLRAVVAVHDAGGIRAAARALDLAQGAVTTAIRELEQGLAVPLLDRGPRGVEFTAYGLRLVARARCIVAQMDLAQRDLGALHAGVETQLNLAVTPLVGVTMLAPLVTQLRRVMPFLTLRVVDAVMPGALLALRQGRVDLVALARSPDIGPEFSYDRLMSVPVTVVAGRGRRPPRGVASLGDLHDAVWIVDGEVEAAMTAAFRARGLPAPARVIRVDDLMAALSLAADTDFLLVLPAPLAADEHVAALLEPLRLDEALPGIEYGLVHRADLPLSPAADRCAALMKRMAASTATTAATRSVRAVVSPARHRPAANNGLQRSA